MKYKTYVVKLKNKVVSRFVNAYRRIFMGYTIVYDIASCRDIYYNGKKINLSELLDIYKKTDFLFWSSSSGKAPTVIPVKRKLKIVDVATKKGRELLKMFCEKFKNPWTIKDLKNLIKIIKKSIMKI